MDAELGTREDDERARRGRMSGGHRSSAEVRAGSASRSAGRWLGAGCDPGSASVPYLKDSFSPISTSLRITSALPFASFTGW
jgi:hypothetical protein